MTIGEVADDLCVTRATALKYVRSGAIPGGEQIYKTDAGRERWMVDRATYEKWTALKSGRSTLPTQST
jgi:predicted transcriptional regulator